jgi:hypothetical protein
MKRYYQAFALSFEASVITRADLYCADEAEAVERAQAMVKDDQPVELWDGTHLIDRFDPKISN